MEIFTNLQNQWSILWLRIAQNVKDQPSNFKIFSFRCVIVHSRFDHGTNPNGPTLLLLHGFGGGLFSWYEDFFSFTQTDLIYQQI